MGAPEELPSGRDLEIDNAALGAVLLPHELLSITRFKHLLRTQPELIAGFKSKISQVIPVSDSTCWASYDIFDLLDQQFSTTSDTLAATSPTVSLTPNYSHPDLIDLVKRHPAGAENAGAENASLALENHKLFYDHQAFKTYLSRIAAETGIPLQADEFVAVYKQFYPDMGYKLIDDTLDIGQTITEEVEALVESITHPNSGVTPQTSTLDFLIGQIVKTKCLDLEDDIEYEQIRNLILNNFKIRKTATTAYVFTGQMDKQAIKKIDSYETVWTNRLTLSTSRIGNVLETIAIQCESGSFEEMILVELGIIH
jgi:hypothetical protein